MTHPALSMAFLAIILSFCVVVIESFPEETNINATQSMEENGRNLDAKFCRQFRVDGNTAGEKNCEMNADDLDTLVSVQVIFRHGQRTPLVSPYPKDPYRDFDYGVEGMGQLTGLGKRWSYILGKYIRCRYDRFLGTSYSTSSLYCQTSETDRTMMSAAAVLAGLFPPTRRDLSSHVDYPQLKWQPIPCTTIPTNVDNKLYRENGGCTRLKQLRTDQMSQYIASLSPKDLEVLQAFANATGLDVKSNTEIFLYYDVIGIQHCQFGLPFPSWFVQMEEKLRPFYLSMFTFGSATVELERLFNGPLWNEILRNFDARLEVERRSNETIVELRGDEIPNVRLAKMYTFSAHDTTISNMLNNLGVYDDQEPPAYNSAILFELHRNSSNSNGTTPSEYLVKVLYRSEFGKNAKELAIPDCNPCSYEAFKDLIANYRTDEAKWKAECGGGSSSTCS